jgi:serine/threonine protein kinase
MLQRGATFGRYTVLEMLGRGGMGEVYAAYDSNLDRKAALPDGN